MPIAPLSALPPRNDPGFADGVETLLDEIVPFAEQANALQADVAAKQVTASAAAGFASVSSAAAEASASAAASGAATATSAASSASASAVEAANLEAQARYIVQQIVIDGPYGIVGMTGYKINLMNFNGTVSNWITTTSTSSKTWTFPDREGTVALASEVPASYKSPIGGSTGKFSVSWVQNAADLSASSNYFSGKVVAASNAQANYESAGLSSASEEGDVYISLHAQGVSAMAFKHTRGVEGVRVVGTTDNLTPLAASKLESFGADFSISAAFFGETGGLRVQGSVPGTGALVDAVTASSAEYADLTLRARNIAVESHTGVSLIVSETAIRTSGDLLVDTPTMYSGHSGIRFGNTFVTMPANNLGFWTSGADSCLKIGSMLNGRSLNAAGTINASGADHAEYMRKADDCGVIAKGQVVGINTDGHITDKWSAAIAFVIKTTNPSYVGGDDIWGRDDVVGKRPETPVRTPDATERRLVSEAVAATDTTPAVEAVYTTVVVTPGDTDQEWAAKESAYATALAAFEEALEAERQKVDRVAIAGQVPVNVMNAIPGQYIVPAPSGDTIVGALVHASEMTLAMYMRAVGKVIALEPDGRARVIVKVA